MQDKAILGKSLLVWLCITPLAVVNGALREFVLAPLLGRLAPPLSGILLGLTIFLMLYLALPRLGRGGWGTYIKMGVLWVVCTVVFETLLGIATGQGMSDILGAYNPRTGNLWVFVVLFTGVCPWLAAKRRKLI